MVHSILRGWQTQGFQETGLQPRKPGKLPGGSDDLGCFWNMGRLYRKGGGRGEVVGRGEMGRAAGQVRDVGSGAWSLLQGTERPALEG